MAPGGGDGGGGEEEGVGREGKREGRRRGGGGRRGEVGWSGQGVVVVVLTCGYDDVSLHATTLDSSISAPRHDGHLVDDLQLRRNPQFSADKPRKKHNTRHVNKHVQELHISTSTCATGTSTTALSCTTMACGQPCPKIHVELRNRDIDHLVQEQLGNLDGQQNSPDHEKNGLCVPTGMSTTMSTYWNCGKSAVFCTSMSATARDAS